MEIKSLTGIRGVAAAYVVVYHASYNKTNLLSNGYLSVDLFFVLSGFIMSFAYAKAFSDNVSYHEYCKFLFYRFARIYPVYLAILLCYIAIYYVFPGKALSPQKLITNLALWQSLFGQNIVGPSWSISAEVFAYFTFPFLFLLLQKKRYLAPILFICCVLVIYTLPYLNEYNNSGPLDIYKNKLALARGWFGFAMGVIAYRVWQSRNIEHKASVKTFQDVMALLMLAVLFAKGFDIVFVVLCALYIPTLAIANGISGKILASRVIYFLGNVSYSLYLIHFLIMKKTWPYVLPYVDSHRQAARILFVFLVSLVIAALAYRFIELPARDGLKAMYRKLSVRAASPQHG